MFKSKGTFSLADMVQSSPQKQESDMSDQNNSNAMPTPDSSTENLPPVRNITAKSAGAKRTKVTAKARQVGASAAIAATVGRKGVSTKRKTAKTVGSIAPGMKRAVLQEQVNYRQTPDLEEADDLGLDGEEGEEELDDVENEADSYDEMDKATGMQQPVALRATKKVQQQKMGTSKPRPRQPKAASTEPTKRPKAATKAAKRVVEEETPDIVASAPQLQAKANKSSKTAKTTAKNGPKRDALGAEQMFIAETQASPGNLVDSLLASDFEEDARGGGDDEKDSPEERLSHNAPSSVVNVTPQKKTKRPQPAPKATRPPSRAASEAREAGVFHRRQPPSATGASKRKRGAGVGDAATTSDVERGVPGAAVAEDGSAPAALRRKLGDVTRQMEHLDNRYRQLREVGVKEAEANFDRLKRQSEENSDAANNLITSLRTELATQTALTGEMRNLQGLLSTRTAELQKGQSQIERLTSALTAAEAENKSLTAKLAAARSAQVQVSESANANANTNANANANFNRRMPGSAVKASSSTGRGAGPGGASATAATNAEINRVTQLAQLKENLYSDLTGLILTNVKKIEDADVFDCIQTGQNGTLHFKLSISPPPANMTTSNTNSYDDIEFVFTPLLDEQRDRGLMELLPNYLTEEITFPRESAEVFYGRVVEALTKTHDHAGR